MSVSGLQWAMSRSELGAGHWSWSLLLLGKKHPKCRHQPHSNVQQLILLPVTCHLSNMGHAEMCRVKTPDSADVSHDKVSVLGKSVVSAWLPVLVVVGGCTPPPTLLM